MSTTRVPGEDPTEHCEACGTDTPHEVRVEMVQAGEGENAKFSNEPYRVAECEVCGTEKREPARCL